MRGNREEYRSEELYWKELAVWGGLLCAAAAPQGGEDPAVLRLAAKQCWDRLEEGSAAGAEAGTFLALPYLAAALNLSRAQTQILALALLPELDRSFERRYGDLDGRGLTAGLILKLLGEDERAGMEWRAAVAPGGALAEYCLEKTGEPGRSGLSCLYRPAERIVAFVLSGTWEDPGRAGLSLCQPKEGAPKPLEELAERMEKYLLRSEGERTSFLIQGQPGSGRRTLALALADRLRTPLLLVEGNYFFGAEPGVFRRSMIREALLQRCPVCLTGLEETVQAARTDGTASEFLERLLYDGAAACCSILVTQEDWTPGGGPSGWRGVPVFLPTPELEESRRLWEEFLGNYPQVEPLDPDRLAGKYRMTPGQIKRALEAAWSQAKWRGLPGLDGASLEQGCRGQLRHGLGDKARKVERLFTWEDLILPEISKGLLRSACDQMRYRRRVYGTWGFGRTMPYGAGLSMLFSGPPGTGKTMAAQIVAGELGLELYKVDLSAVVSKYVGETEKNLSEIFREAERSQAVLFFDEADVLFGKRTEVKDSHDKYNNMEAAYLLQKMEEYSGVSVLATNFLQNFDEAFKRRLKFIIEFPFPDLPYRRLLWRAVFPPQTPLEGDIDWEFLAAQFELSGSGIKNVAVNAAFLAAGEDAPVGMPHLLTALRRELYKSGKVLTRADFGEYYMLAEEGEHERL